MRRSAKKPTLKNSGWGVLYGFTLAVLTYIIFSASTARVIDAQVAPKLNLGDPLPANVFVELAKLINPSVVNISTSSRPRMGGMYGGPRGMAPGDPFSDMFEQFLGPQMRQMPARPQQALGTGFIIRSDGLILTNNHVVEDADVIKVQISEKDTTLYTAEVIGRDKRTDLALIKIDAKKTLPAVKLGTSANVQVGEWVAAFGNPLGLGHTTTKGIVSAIGREIDELNRFPFIQTDASINPGNSGGPLVNLQGEVIGVNAAIAANSQGIGFAIPIDNAKDVIKLLEKDGSVKRGFFGVTMYPRPIDPQAAQEMKLNRTDGALIVGVVDGSPASKAGMREYDFVTKFNGKEVSNPGDFSRFVADAEVGKKYKIDFIRNGKATSTQVALEEHPDDLKQVQSKKKTYRGQKAPFDLGFTLSNYTAEIGRKFGLPQLRKPFPVVIEVDPDSPAGRAGLNPGDVVMDVNRKEVTKDTDVLKQLLKGQINSLRILRGQYVTLIYLNAKRE